MNFEVIWARLTRVASFFGGMAIMGYETVGDKGERPWLYAAAIGMMGLPVARAAEELISHFAARGPVVLPKQHTVSETEVFTNTPEEVRGDRSGSER